MSRYVYGYHIQEIDGEVWFQFPKFPEIFSALPKKTFKAMSPSEISYHATDALVVTLQSYVVARKDLPENDNPDLMKADGFISLPVQQAMKLELYKVYKENCRSVADFARQIGKSETLARRLLDLRHRSLPTEIEEVVALFGKHLVHDWRVELSPILPSPHSRQLAHHHP